MHVLITRPRKQAEKLASTLIGRKKLSAVVSPLLTVYTRTNQQEQLEKSLVDNPQAIIITSSNGADSLAELTARRDIPILAVGNTSCETARNYGFNAISCGGTVQLLVEYIKKHYPPEGRALLYLSGDVVTWDFIPFLQQEGYAIKRIVLYSTVEETNLPDQLRQVLIAKEPFSALFFSKRTAAIFSKLVQKETLEEGVVQSAAFVLSGSIVPAVKTLQWNVVHIAESPTQQAMIALLDRYIKEYYG